MLEVTQEEALFHIPLKNNDNITTTTTTRKFIVNRKQTESVNAADGRMSNAGAGDSAAVNVGEQIFRDNGDQNNDHGSREGVSVCRPTHPPSNLSISQSCAEPSNSNSNTDRGSQVINQFSIGSEPSHYFERISHNETLQQLNLSCERGRHIFSEEFVSAGNQLNGLQLDKKLVLQRYFRSALVGPRTDSLYENLCRGCNYGVFTARGPLCTFCELLVSGATEALDSPFHSSSNIYENVCEKCHQIYSHSTEGKCNCCLLNDNLKHKSADNLDSSTSEKKVKLKKSHSFNRTLSNFINNLRKPKRTVSNGRNDERKKTKPPLEIVHNVDGYDQVFHTQDTFDLNRICELKSGESNERNTVSQNTQPIYGRIKEKNLSKTSQTLPNHLRPANGNALNAKSHSFTHTRITNLDYLKSLQTTLSWNKRPRISKTKLLRTVNPKGNFDCNPNTSSNSAHLYEIDKTELQHTLHLADDICHWMTSLQTETHTYDLFRNSIDAGFDIYAYCQPKSIPALRESILSKNLMNHRNRMNAGIPQAEIMANLLNEGRISFDDDDDIGTNSRPAAENSTISSKQQQAVVPNHYTPMIQTFKDNLLSKQMPTEEPGGNVLQRCCPLAYENNSLIQQQLKRKGIYLKWEETDINLNRSGIQPLQFERILDTKPATNSEARKRYATCEYNSEFLNDVLIAFDNLLKGEKHSPTSQETKGERQPEATAGAVLLDLANNINGTARGIHMKSIDGTESILVFDCYQLSNSLCLSIGLNKRVLHQDKHQHFLLLLFQQYLNRKEIAGKAETLRADDQSEQYQMFLKYYTQRRRAIDQQQRRRHHSQHRNDEKQQCNSMHSVLGSNDVVTVGALDGLYFVTADVDRCNNNIISNNNKTTSNNNKYENESVALNVRILRQKKSKPFLKRNKQKQYRNLFAENQVLKQFNKPNATSVLTIEQLIEQADEKFSILETKYNIIHSNRKPNGISKARSLAALQLSRQRQQEHKQKAQMTVPTPNQSPEISYPKASDEDSIYQPIWKFHTVGDELIRESCISDQADDDSVVSPAAATNFCSRCRDEASARFLPPELLITSSPNQNIEDDNEWETDDEFMFTTQFDEVLQLENGMLWKQQAVAFGDTTSGSQHSCCNSISSSMATSSLSGSTITGFGSNCSNNNTLATSSTSSSSSRRHPFYRNVGIFYSPTDPKLRAIIYDYDRLHASMYFAKTTTVTGISAAASATALVAMAALTAAGSPCLRRNHDIGLGKGNKSLPTLPNAINSSHRESVVSDEGALQQQKQHLQRSTAKAFGNRQSLPDSVQAWKFLLLDVNYLDDEEDMFVSEYEILRAREIKEQELETNQPTTNNVLQRFKSISSSNLIDLPNEEDKKTIAERMRNKLQRGVFKINARSPKSEKKHRGLFRRNETTSLYLEDGLKPKYPIFGVALDQLELNHTNHRNVPRFVVDSVQFIEQKENIIQDGLYRACGNKFSIDDLKQKLSESYIYDPKLLAAEDIHTITSLLKQFFRELASPLIPQSTYVRLRHNLVDELGIDSIRQAFDDMPDPNYSTLKFLIKHLTHVAAFSTSNRMNASNLAIVWGPCLLSANQIEYDIGRMNTFAKVLIENFYRIFSTDNNERLVC